MPCTSLWAYCPYLFSEYTIKIGPNLYGLTVYYLFECPVPDGELTVLTYLVNKPSKLDQTFLAIQYIMYLNALYLTVSLLSLLI